MLRNLALILGNYALVQGSIILFALPFFLVHTLRHRLRTESTLGASQRVEEFVTSRSMNYLAFAWALGEALVWFVIPEFLLLLVVFMRRAKKVQLLIYDVLGTLAGTVIALFVHLPMAQLVKLPYIQPNMVHQVEQWYDQFGMFGLVLQPFSGVPYKVFTSVGAGYSFFLPAFLLLAVMVRISRYVIFYTMFTTIYPVLHRFVYRHYAGLFVGASFVFSLMLLKVYSLYGPI